MLYFGDLRRFQQQNAICLVFVLPRPPKELPLHDKGWKKLISLNKVIALHQYLPHCPEQWAAWAFHFLWGSTVGSISCVPAKAQRGARQPQPLLLWAAAQSDKIRLISDVIRLIIVKMGNITKHSIEVMQVKTQSLITFHGSPKIHDLY